MSRKNRKGGETFVGLREVVREIVERDVLRASAAQARSGWLVLVLDATASRVLTPILGMYDLMEERISLVESLEKRRQPFPEFDVIYVAGACEKSIRAIKADWVGRSSDMYGDAHVFFLSRLKQDQLAELGTAGGLTRRLKTLSELNLDFLAVEAQAFTLGEASAFTQLSVSAAGGPGYLDPIEINTAKKFATVCATLGETKPIFRYKSERAHSFAETAWRELRESTTMTKSKQNKRGTATVLILDRADDPLTPLLHEYSYQALVHDMLLVQGDSRDRVSYAKATKAGELKEEIALLNENDALWIEFRHAHIARVVDALRSRVTDFLAHNAGAAQLSRGAGRDLSLGDMAQALKRMPEFQAATAALNKHMTLSHECLSKFHAFNLLEQSQLEQTLATGLDDDGIKVSKPQSVLSQVCNTTRAAASSTSMRSGASQEEHHALRLVAVYFVARGGRLAEAERAQILDALNPTPRQRDALLTLSRLVARTVGPDGKLPAVADAAKLTPILQAALAQRQSAKQKKPYKKSKFSMLNALKSAARGGSTTSLSGSQANAGDDDVASSRYIPPAKTIIEAAAYDRLPEDLYPRLPGAGTSSASAAEDYSRGLGLPAPPNKVAAQSVRNRANRNLMPPGAPGGALPAAGGVAASRAAKSFVGPRLIVIVLGGVTYSELRSAYEISDATNREVLIGGTSLLAPSTFISNLSGGK